MIIGVCIKNKNLFIGAKFGILQLSNWMTKSIQITTIERGLESYKNS